jgi:hypothetical protein
MEQDNMVIIISQKDEQIRPAYSEINEWFLEIKQVIFQIIAL